MDQNFIELLLGECVDPNLSLPDPELVQYYQNLENRIIWLDGEITSGSLDIFSKILYWNREDKEVSIKDRKPIKIFINSVGGDLDAADTLVSTIKLSKTPIYGFALGMVASAASLIYLACHKRYALPNAEIMIHQPLGGAQGQATDIKISADHIIRTRTKLNTLLSEATGRPLEEIERDTERDNWKTAEEALEYGLIDKIVTNRK